MGPIGFSTGALAKADFRTALAMLRPHAVDAVELSALRFRELKPLAEAASSLDLSRFRFVSVHAPSSFTAEEEPWVVEQLGPLVDRGWPVVLHPDTIHSFERWTGFGDLLLVENMDKRKPCGRTVSELEEIFARLPDARLCFDIAHARQFDSSMIEAYRILKAFRSRIAQLHVSEVNTFSRHDRLSTAAVRAFQEVAAMIPADASVILESPVREEEIGRELEQARLALTRSASAAA